MAPATAGREAELATLVALTSRHRVVTITGAGGIGKTSLAKLLLDRLGGTFVDMVPVRSREGLVEALAVAFSLGRTGVDEADTSAIVAALERRGDSLVVLDNAEHLVPEVRWAVNVLGRTRLRLVVTSRVPLDVRDERRFELGPLAEHASVSLLRTHLERENVTADEGAMRELARRADGVPLAIELLAAQARHLPIAEILASFEQTLMNAASPFADTEPRHRSIEAALESSWTGLDDDDRRRLHAFTAFNDVFGVADAERLEPGALEALKRLHGRSFVVLDRDRRRWKILEPIRDFVRHRCGAPTEEHRARHATLFRDKAQEWAQALYGPGCLEAAEWFEAQLFDALAAFDALRAEGRAEDAVRLACSLDEIIAVRGPSTLSLRLLGDDALLDATPPPLRAAASFCRGRALVLLGRREEAERALAQACDEASSPGRPRLWRALLRYWFGDVEAARAELTKVAAMGERATPADAALTLLYLGAMQGEAGEDAESVFARAARIIEENGLVVLRPRLIVYRLHFLRRRLPRPQIDEWLEEALRITDGVRDYRFSAAVLTAMGDVSFLGRDAESATRSYERAERRYEEVGFHTAVPMVTLSRAFARWLAGDLVHAQRLLGSLAHDLGKPIPNRWFAAAALAALHAEMGERQGARDALSECTEAKPRGVVAERFLALCQMLVRDDGDALSDAESARASADATPGSSSELQLMQTLVVERLRLRASSNGETLPRVRVAGDGTWFEAGGGPRVHIARRRALMRLLDALAQRAPDGWLTAESAFASGWPGERAALRSAALRVYSAIARLRALGLGDALETGPGGYRLRARVERDA